MIFRLPIYFKKIGSWFSYEDSELAQGRDGTKQLLREREIRT